MSSRKPSSSDELDNLVRGALHAQVGEQEAPDRVWQRIKLGLEADQAAVTPPRKRISWSPLAVQVALTLLLVMFGGVGLRTLLSPDGVAVPTPHVSPAGRVIYEEEQPTSPGVPVPDDTAELRTLKASPRPPTASQPGAVTESSPPILVPQDAPPNVLSPEGQALKAERSSPLLAREQHVRQSGPYPWAR